MFLCYSVSALLDRGLISAVARSANGDQFHTNSVPMAYQAV
jgi:hypothetical protein